MEVNRSLVNFGVNCHGALASALTPLGLTRLRRSLQLVHICTTQMQMEPGTIPLTRRLNALQYRDPPLGGDSWATRSQTTNQPQQLVIPASRPGEVFRKNLNEPMIWVAGATGQRGGTQASL